MDVIRKVQKPFDCTTIPIDAQTLTRGIRSVLTFPSSGHLIGIAWKHRLECILWFVFLVCSFAYGAPYWGEKIDVRQPDGNKVPVVVFGDEFFQYVETPDGYPLIRDPQTGWVQYAVINKIEDDFEPTGIIYNPTQSVDPEDPRIQAFLASQGKGIGQKSRLQKHQRLPSKVVREKARKSRHLLGREFTYSVEDEMVYSYDATLMNPPAPLFGSITGLTVLIQFPDEAGTISATEVSDYCNQQGYTGNGNNGSVRDYFYSVSNGQLTYTNVIKGYYTATHNKSYYNDPSRPEETRARELIIEALNWLDDPNGQNYEFRDISKDSNNNMIALNALYVGTVDTAWGEGLWPHMGTMSGSFTSNEGVKVYTYQINAMGSGLTLGTFCHENGHMICGYADLYDYDSDSFGVGNYCLMAYAGSSTNPVPPNAYFRHLKGWEAVTDLSPSSTGTYPLTANTNTSYRFLNPNNSDEFFMIESRRRSDRNRSLPDEGLLIWHIDAAVGNNDHQDMTVASHYMVSVEQADNAFHLENHINKGDDGDLYHAGYEVQFHFQTSPGSSWWDGTDSRLRISSVSEISNTMCFTLESLPYGGGSGTPEDPFQIWTPQQMNAIGANAGDWSKHFNLMADIDLSVYPGTQYKIIGNASQKFTGTMDGNGHVIRNLIYRTTAVVDYVGLFGYLDHAMIQNLGVENISLWTGGRYVGGLVGCSLSSTLTACHAEGSVEGARRVGGLVGGNSSGSITNCYVVGCVNGDGDLGGLVGYNEGLLTNCYATGSVYGTDNLGGLVGNNSGLATDCYAAVGVGGTINVGGLVGLFASGTMTACLWDIQTSGQGNGIGSGSSNGVTGKTTPEMMTQSTFTDTGWDFASTWAICEGTNYPRLRLQKVPVTDWICPDGVGTEDLLYLSARWLATAPDTSGPADTNHDGQVNLSDFAILAENWLEGS